MGVRIYPLKPSENDYAGEWFNFTQVKALTMRNDQIFVLLLVVLLPMSGCFGDSVEDAEGSEADATNTLVYNYYNSTVDEIKWFSSGGEESPVWKDGQFVESGQSRCIEYGPTYDSSSGDYLGEECKEYGLPASELDWNLTDCTSNGGEILWDYSYPSPDKFAFAPRCKKIVKTISTEPGQALFVYQASGFDLKSVCMNSYAETPPQIYDWDTYELNNYQINGEYNILPGAALSCDHELFRIVDYSPNPASYVQYAWSIVYTIENTVIV